MAERQKQIIIAVGVTEEYRETVHAFARKRNFRTLSSYLVHLINQDMEKHKTQE